ncbi:hypothetical protein MSG28_010973 [Choristoneura fumiferana]|nr:hypothetical protein MSG28_010973 [Choristoneura fumiferana]
MPSNSENAFDLTSNPCPYTFPDQRDLRNDVIALETTGNVETAQPRRRLTPRKGRSTRPARRTAPATSDPTYDVVKDKKVRKSKILHERTPDEPEEKRAKGVIGCCSICLEEFGSNPLAFKTNRGTTGSSLAVPGIGKTNHGATGSLVGGTRDK